MVDGRADDPCIGIGRLHHFTVSDIDTDMTFVPYCKSGNFGNGINRSFFYYNIIWLEPSAASRGFRPSRAKATIRGATGWPLLSWAIKSGQQTVSHPLVAAFGLSRLSLEFASPNRLNRQREKDGFRLQILYWGNERELCRH